jgi:FkbM family methyltransferase
VADVLWCPFAGKVGVGMLESYAAWFAEYCADGKFYHKVIHNIIQCFVRSGQVVIDCGAHSGRHTFPLCEKVGTSGRVYAIEPITSLATQLKRKALPQLRVVEAAITDFQGATNFFHRKDEEASSAIVPYFCPIGAVDMVSVAARTLDGIVSEDETVRFLKLDIEGAEFDALRGARRILERDRPLIIFEHGSVESASRYNYNISEFRDFWDDLGYVVVDLFGRSRQGTRFEDASVRYLVAGADQESLELIDNMQIPVTLASQQLTQSNY